MQTAAIEGIASRRAWRLHLATFQTRGPRARSRECRSAPVVLPDNVLVDADKTILKIVKDVEIQG